MDSTTTGRGQRMARSTVVAGAAGVVAGVVTASIVATALRAGDATPVRTGDEFTAVVTNLSPRSVCVDRTEDTCGVPLLLPDDEVQVGDRVAVTEVWLTRDGIETLGFYLRPPDA